MGLIPRRLRRNENIVRPVWFSGQIPRPLGAGEFISFLVYLHSLFGQNYEILMAFQAGVFAILPAWSQFHSSVGIKVYERTRTNSAIALQKRVDEVNAQGGEILFITQPHLISMGMLQNVTLVPQYERDDLMEMAMDGNTEYLSRFRDDMESQRFKFIIVDPLKFQFLGSDRSFGEENNVWVRWAIKPILCNYQLDVAYPEYDIAIYVP